MAKEQSQGAQLSELKESPQPLPPVIAETLLQGKVSELPELMPREIVAKELPRIMSPQVSVPRCKFIVRYKDIEVLVLAENSNDAWAIFCDKMQDWPSPKSPNRSIQEVN